MKMHQSNISAALKVGDIAFQNAIEQIKNPPSGNYGLPSDHADINRFAEEARIIIHGQDGRSGIAGQLATSTDTTETIEILTNAMKTFFSQEQKTVGQLARSYTVGFTQSLKQLESSFADAIEKKKQR